ncbi:MAG: phosphohydrolase, partial [Syntrophobacteraceae bacterium CG23_combo_of_CG06-09_8_20_14_all_50_8]
MERALSEYLYLFAIFSLSGWVLEFIFRSLRLRKLTNPGFLRGPYLPIYGTGAVFLYLASLHLSGSHFLIKVLAYFVITTGLEFTTGFFLEEFFHIRLWDYSKESLRVKNFICLKYSLYWVVLALACEYLLFPPVMALYCRLIPPAFQIAGVITCLMFVESAWKFGRLFAAKKREKTA